jgi:DNA-binding Xre family transcriptional regulator
MIRSTLERMAKVNWRVSQLLKDHDLTPYKFMKATGLAQGTAYSIANGKGEAVRLDTLGAVISGLEQLIGRKVELADLFEIAREA